jgi:hypothetical protein
MKKFIYFLLFFFASFVANSQVQRPANAPSPNSPTGYSLYGYVRADSGFIWKQRDTFPAKFPTIIWHTNGNFYKTNGNGGAWSLFVSGTASTVSSVSGNAPISVANGTTTPTISVDTSYNGLTTKKWLYKSVDSLGFLKLNISDTAAMLLSRLKVSDTSFMLSGYLRKGDTAQMLSNYVPTYREINTNSPLFGGGNLTTNRTLGADTGRNAAQLVTGGSLTAVKDSLVALIASSGGGTVLDVSTTDGYGIVSSVADPTSTPNISLRVDTFAISTRDWRNKGVDSAISVIPLRITDSLANVNRIKAGTSGGGIVQTNTGATAFSWGGGGSQQVDFHGFAGYDANRSSTYTVRSFTDKRYVDSSLALRLLIGDTATMLSNYRRTTTKIQNSDLANSTISGVSLGGTLNALTFGQYLQVGASSYDGSVATTITTNGTATNVGSTLVARDANGDFTARNISATNFLGTASTASTVAITNDITTNATYYPMFSTVTTGSTSTRVSSSKLTYNPSTGALSSTGFIGALTGNATTASTLQTARTINGVAFDGSANITISASVDSSLSAGYGITGSPFNGSLGRTWVIDTSNISTKANVTGALVAKLNISDTTAMLSGYKTYYPRTAISAGTGITYDATTGVITNSSPSSGGTVTSVATNNGSGITGGTITSTGTIAADTSILSTKANVVGLLVGYTTTAANALKLNISDTATMLSNYRRTTTKITNSDLTNSAITINGSSTSLGGSISVGTVTSVAASAGTGISVSGSPITTSGTLTITNTAPDQTVALTSGTGISVTGTYPNFTITNSSPSSGGTVTSVATSAPITGGTITSTGTIGITQSTTTTDGYLSSTDWNTFNNKASTASVALKLNISDTASMLSNYRRKTTLIENADLRNSAITINGSSTSLGGSISVGTVTSVGATAGTGISVSGSPITSSGSITITNTAPDQTVALTGGTGISISGTYPNFTITNSSPSSGGTVTSVATNTGSGITGGTITSSGTLAIDTSIISTKANVTGLLVGYATTSALSGYLPLTAGSGQALTGDLYGTNLLFSGYGSFGTVSSTATNLVAITSSYAAANTERGSIAWGDGSGIVGKIYSTYNGSNSTKLHFGGLYNGAYNGTDVMMMDGLTKATTLYGALNGTSAAFSGNINQGGGTASNTAGFTNNLYLESNIPSITLSNTGSGTGKYTIGATAGAWGLWNNTTSDYEIRIDPLGNGLINFGRGINGTSAAFSGGVSIASGNNLTWGGAYGANIPTLVGISGATPYLAIYAAGSTSSETDRFTANGSLLIKTAVDNGTDALQVAGSVSATTYNSTSAIVVNASGRTTSFQDLVRGINTSGDFLLTVEGSAAGTRFTGSSAYASVLGTNTNTSLQLGTNNIVRATLTSSGNFGINNAGTNAKLEVTASSGEVFRADAASGAFRIIANQTGVLMNGGGATTSTLELGSGDNATVSSPYSLVFQSNNTGAISGRDIVFKNGGKGYSDGTTLLTIASTGAATFSSSVTASSLIKSGGTSAQFLKADGSVDGSTYLTSAGAVTSISGTTNQITVSASTGAVTVSLPSAVTISGAMTASSFFESSSIKLKDVISRDGEVAYFKWKDKRDDRTHIGYIAEEVQKKNPDQVMFTNDHLAVNYIEILVQKVRALEKKIEKLEKKDKKTKKDKN